MATYGGTGVVATTDYHTVVWTGKTKGGNSVVITLTNAINMGNLDWTFAEKDDTVAEVEFQATYSNTDAASTSTTEPFTVEFTTGSAASDDIMLGAGVLSIDGTDIALTRGGGQFTVEREYREINADGDRGAVYGRVVIDASRPKLKVNALTILTSFADLYPAVATQA